MSQVDQKTEDLPGEIPQLIAVGDLFHRNQWLPATGGNFSCRLGEQDVLITASGCHKGELTERDFLLANLDAEPVEPGRKLSYETGLHCQIYRRDKRVRSVLHTHSLANTVLSRQRDSIRLAGYELLKILPGIETHDTSVEIPVFENDQDIGRLSSRIDRWMDQNAVIPAYLIAGHGMYAWGSSIAAARYRVEALEFLFACELHGN